MVIKNGGERKKFLDLNRQEIIMDMQELMLQSILS